MPKYIKNPVNVQILPIASKSFWFVRIRIQTSSLHCKWRFCLFSLLIWRFASLPTLFFFTCWRAKVTVLQSLCWLSLIKTSDMFLYVLISSEFNFEATINTSWRCHVLPSESTKYLVASFFSKLAKGVFGFCGVFFVFLNFYYKKLQTFFFKFEPKKRKGCNESPCKHQSASTNINSLPSPLFYFIHAFAHFLSFPT